MRSVSSARPSATMPHQLDAAARAVVFVAHFGERRAARRTQPAVNAAEEQLVADFRRRVFTVWLVQVVEAVGGHASAVRELSGIKDVLGVETLLDRPHHADFRAEIAGQPRRRHHNSREPTAPGESQSFFVDFTGSRWLPAIAIGVTSVVDAADANHAVAGVGVNRAVGGNLQ